MKRDAAKIPGYVQFRLLSNYTAKQLELIGSIAVLYNGCEHILHNAVGHCIEYRGNTRDITTRINGTEGLIAIIVSTSPRLLGVEPPDHEAIKATLEQDGFSRLKSYRDAVVHSMPYNQLMGVGRSPGRRGKSVDVLLAEPALQWLATALSLLRDEMSEMASLLLVAGTLNLQADLPPERRKPLEEALPIAKARFHEAQAVRRKHRTPPKFPDVSDLGVFG